MKDVIAKGNSQTDQKRVGENFYNRGVMNAAMIAEAIRNAQKITGKKESPVTKCAAAWKR